MSTLGISRPGTRRLRSGVLSLLILVLALGVPGSLVAQVGTSILKPEPGDIVFITPTPLENPPTLLELQRVVYADTVDAFAYEIELFGPSPTTIYIPDFLAGDYVAAPLVLPDQTLAGNYEMRGRALDEGGIPIGDWSLAVPFEVQTMAADPFMPVSSMPVSGVIMASEVLIPADVTLTAESDFTILSVGPVTIDGAVIGAPGFAPGEMAPVITILSRSEVTMAGMVVAGDGAHGMDMPTGEVSHAGHGGRGGSTVVMTHDAPLNILPSATIHSGNGGQGGSAVAVGADASAPGEPGGDATAIAGDGGDGGDLIVYAAGGPFGLPLVQDLLYCGDGGAGGNATATGGNGGPEDAGVVLGPGGGAEAQGGAGGNSGSLFVDPYFLDANGDMILTPEELQIVGGGHGGNAGTTEAIGGDNGLPLDKSFDKAPDCFRPNGAKPATVTVTGNAGGAGWVNPGKGSDAFARGLPGPPGGDGGDAVATGGKGGDLKTVGVSIGPFSIGWNTASSAGDGGKATAYGGKGGAPSGSGGNGTATGGDGGNAPTIGIPNIGGFGGAAIARGGYGRRAPDCCRPPQPNPHNGGNGGAATATGGNGGRGSQYGGNGGFAIASAGACGNGGDGNGPSSGGVPGPANATGGNGGAGLVFNGNNGTASRYPSSNCHPGKLCVPQCTTDEVKEKETGEPIDGVDDCQETGGEKATVPCAVFCPAGDMNIVNPALQYVSGMPVADLPPDRYGMMVESRWFGGDVPTDPLGNGAISYAAANVGNGGGCSDGYIMACGTYVAGPIRVMSVDLDANGKVDQADVDLMNQHMGSTDGCFDFDGNGIVDLVDVSILQQHFGHQHPLSGVSLPVVPLLELNTYPNPFNPRTTVSYHLPATGQVNLKIVDLKGRLVRTLVDGIQRAGLHEVPWNGMDDGSRPVSSGVYLVVLETARGTSTGKVAVLK